MLVAIGYTVILALAFGGYMLAGRHLGSLFQPTGLLIIFDAGIGALMIGNDKKAISAIVKALPGLSKGSKYIKALYMEVMALLYAVPSKIRREGMVSIEADIENPHESALFTNCPAIQADHHALDFICDYLRLMVGDNLNPFQIEALMDQEIDTHHRGAEQPAHVIAKVDDAIPAFGIMTVAMGMVHTIDSVGLLPAELGKLIASALIGTLPGILLAYGSIGSLDSLLEQHAEEPTKLFQYTKVTLLASTNGYAPVIAMEFGRKVLFSTERPSSAGLEDRVRGAKTA